MKRVFFNRFYYSLFVLLFLFSCKKPDHSVYSINKHEDVEHAGVVTAHPEATKIGLEILKNGGNAADAAIAVQFALAVCYPRAGNIGGGGFLLYRDSMGEVTSLDFREKAPGQSTRDMYLDNSGNPIDEKSKLGALACGVPGTVDGMYTLFLRYSRLKDWSKLVLPAVLLAENGCKLTASEAEILNKYQHNFRRFNKHSIPFLKENWRTGDILKQPDLARTLRLIMENGRNGFYKGPTAEKMINAMQKHNGLISADDLDSYSSVWRNPVSTEYRGYRVFSMGPPSSGGIALIQLLELTEKFDFTDVVFQKCEHITQNVLSERIVFGLREQYLGDPDYYHVPILSLTDSAILNTYQYHPTKFTDHHTMVEKEETTHYSIVDEFGNSVSVTTTLNGNFGSYFIPEGTGFIMNNEMDDFSVKSGHPNMFGVIGHEANRIEPGKRMLSSMTPTIITKDEKLFAVLGTPGGSTIITSVFQIIQNLIDFKMEPFEAVAAGRFHYQGKPDTVFYEERVLTTHMIDQLQAIRYHAKQRSPIGRVELICISPEGIIRLAADPRGDDDAKGY